MACNLCCKYCYLEDNTIDEQTNYGVLDTLKYAKVPLVIDADALTILSQNTHLLKESSVPIVLTPHIGEFKRLTYFNDESSPTIILFYIFEKNLNHAKFNYPFNSALFNEPAC